MKKRSIFASAFRGYLVTIGLLALITPFLIFGTVRSRFRESALEDLTRTALTLRELIQPLFFSGSFDNIESLTDSLGPEIGVRITVISRDGLVLADSEKNPAEMENHRTRPEIIQAFNGIHGSSARYSSTLGQEMLYAAVPIYSSDSIPAVVRTSFFLSQLRATMNELALNILAAVLSVLAVATAIAWYSARRLTSPIRRLAEVSTEVRNGDFTARAEPCAARELDELSVSFNATIARTEELVDTLSSVNLQNRAILTSIGEGLAVVEGSGRIVMTNEVFMDMSGAQSGENYMESVTVAPVRDFIRNAFESGARSGRMETEGRCYVCSVADVKDTDRKVFTFRDVTELAQVARMKRDFAINVSHELRTPLTSIKGFTETLLADAEGDTREYLRTIARNTDRLINLVKDVQILSEMEDMSRAMELEPVDPVELLREVMVLFRDRAMEKGLELDLGVRGDIPPVMGDRFRLEQVFVNLIDNAIKYTDTGGVAISVRYRGSMVVTAVSDTGNGIPEEHLPRVFERFYVVDRSRSRSMGGTGLGLAIVKHIVALHGGKVTVNSSPARGTTFTVFIPAAEQAPLP
jgi:two-component system phosphate regulon sensor histidine kinase PhoR